MSIPVSQFIPPLIHIYFSISKVPLGKVPFLNNSKSPCLLQQMERLCLLILQLASVLLLIFSPSPGKPLFTFYPFLIT